MPIYGDMFKKNNWVIELYMNQLEILSYIKILKEAKTKFLYKYDEVFLSSIDENFKCNEVYYIASYDYSKTGMSESLYIHELENLIDTCNLIMRNKKKYNNYKFDIAGSWTDGKIIIMRNKK